MDHFGISGASEKACEPLELRAGPVSLLFDGSEIRYLSLGGHEILRRVYVAVRDRNWLTIPPRVSDLKVARHDLEFAICFHVTHANDDVAFGWDGRITGDQNGRIRFEMDGIAEKGFQTNRTGFCVLHPAIECARPNLHRNGCRNVHPYTSTWGNRSPRQRNT